MKISLAIVALLLLGAVSLAQESSWNTKAYHMLLDGNRLYTDCQSAEKNVRMAGEHAQVRTEAGSDDLFLAGLCWGYVTAVVDSIPVGEGFEPDLCIPAWKLRRCCPCRYEKLTS